MRSWLPSEEAKRIASEFDIDDWPFIALALRFKIPVWTNDKEIVRHSLKTSEYQAINTSAILESLEKLKSRMRPT